MIPSLESRLTSTPSALKAGRVHRSSKKTDAELTVVLATMRLTSTFAICAAHWRCQGEAKDFS